MKRFLLFCAVLLLTVSGPARAITYGLTSYQQMRGADLSRMPADFFYQFVNEVEGILEGTTALGYLYMTPTDTEPGTTEGLFYADDSENILKYYNGSAWVSLGSGTFTGGSITSNITMSNGVYMRSTTTTAQTTGVQVYDTDGSWENALLVTNGSTAAVALGDTAATLAIASSGGINVTTAGAVTGVTDLTMTGTLSGITNLTLTGILDTDSITLGNEATITNDTDTEVYITEGGEDIGWDFTSNSVTWKSSTGVVGMNFGDVDAFSGINTIAMDAAASSLSLAADGSDDDLTVSVTGAQDASLILASSGTAADALQITTTAGGIDITNGGASGTEDLDITSTNASIHMVAGEAATDGVNIDATGGVDIDAADDIALTVTSGTAGEDLILEQVGANNSSILLTAAGTGADAIGLAASAGTVKIAGNFLDLDSTEDLNITVTSSTGAEDLLLTQTGGNDSSIILSAAGTGTDAISLQASAGSIDIDAASAKDVDIAGGQVLIASKDNAASAIALTTNVGATETIVITNTQGTSAAAINIDATVGGMDIDLGQEFDVAAANDVTITLTSSEAGEDMSFIQSGANDSSIIVQAAGTGTDAISLAAAAGTVKVSGNLLDLDSTNDTNITVTSSEAGEDLLLTQSGANDSSIVLTAAGTGSDAISLQASAGSVDIDAAAAKDVDIAGGQVAISSKDNAASAISLTANVGATETIVVTNTQGTGEGAITLTSTAGGIDLNAAAAKNITADGGQILLTSTDAAANQIKLDATGAIDGDALILETTNGNIFLNADGADYGDIDLDAADDMTLTAAGNLTLAVTGTYSLGGAVPTNTLAWIEVIGADDTLLANESGKTIVVDGNDVAAGDVVLTLPTAAAGLWFNFIDVNSTAADDLVVTAAAGDTINGGAAAGSYRCSGDAAKQHVTLIAVDATRWEVAAENGTWANE